MCAKHSEMFVWQLVYLPAMFYTDSQVDRSYMCTALRTSNKVTEISDPIYQQTGKGGS
jgi:hypothetical protein